MEIRIQQHPESKEHQIAIVTTARGYVYATTFAPMDEPLTNEFIERDWKQDRKGYRPYDESTGRYV